MSRHGISRQISGTVLFVLLGLIQAERAGAQTFSSGSTGADGAFAPTTSTTVALPTTGAFNFTTVTIPAGVTVTFTPNAANTPVTILATGNVTIAGTPRWTGRPVRPRFQEGLPFCRGRQAALGAFAGVTAGLWMARCHRGNGKGQEAAPSWGTRPHPPSAHPGSMGRRVRL